MLNDSFETVYQSISEQVGKLNFFLNGRKRCEIELCFAHTGALRSLSPTLISAKARPSGAALPHTQPEPACLSTARAG